MKERRYDITGVCSGIVDVLVEVYDEDLKKLGLEPGTFGLVSKDEQVKLIESVRSYSPRLVSGGSVANSLVMSAQLGAKVGCICPVGDDRYGLHFLSEMENLGMVHRSSPMLGKSTGVCLSLISPDGTRTMRTFLGSNADFSSKDLDPQLIASSKWLLVEGFLICNGEHSVAGVREAIKIAESNGVKVALTLSDKFVVDNFKPVFDEFMTSTDLVVCNEHEASALTGKDDPRGSLELIAKIVPNVVVTAGGNGAYFSVGNESGHVQAFPCVPRDLTGAGDAFAGGLLYGLVSGLPPKVAAQGAAFMAREVVIQIGARFQGDAKTRWQEGVVQ